MPWSVVIPSGFCRRSRRIRGCTASGRWLWSKRSLLISFLCINWKKAKHKCYYELFLTINYYLKIIPLHKMGSFKIIRLKIRRFFFWRSKQRLSHNRFTQQRYYNNDYDDCARTVPMTFVTWHSATICCSFLPRMRLYEIERWRWTVKFLNSTTTLSKREFSPSPPYLIHS